MPLSIQIARKERYKPGDLGFTVSEDDIHWLAEIQSIERGGYRVRLTKMNLNPETGKYVVNIDSGTNSYIPRNELQSLRSDKIDFSSLATWQKYVDSKRRNSPNKYFSRTIEELAENHI